MSRGWSIHAIDTFPGSRRLDPAEPDVYGQEMTSANSPSFFFRFSLALFLALASPPAALAAPEAAGAAVREDRFLLLDTDGDGDISPEEFAVGLPHMRRAAFFALDADADGRISREEWLRARMGHMPAGPLPAGDPAVCPFPPSVPGNGTLRGPDLLLPRGGEKP